MQYVQEFLVIALIHLLAVASPGPDFAIILKQSLLYGRRTAIFTSIGIGAGILVHVTYSLIGVGILIASNELIFTLLKYIAACYFCYIAWHSLRAKKPTSEGEKSVEEQVNQKTSSHKKVIEKPVPSDKKAFVLGFMINALNVKATLFFVSLFSIVISIQTPFIIKLSYGIYMTLATALWFSGLSYFLGQEKVRQLLVYKGYWLERIMGVILLLLAVELVMSDLTPA